MNHLIVRPGVGRGYYDYENNTGADLTQNHFVLKVTGSLVPFPVLGSIPDHNGIEDGATGKIESDVASVWTLESGQLADDIVTMAVDDPIYMAPGAGNIHAVAAAGDYRIGYVIAAQGTNTYLDVQLTPPEIVPTSEIGS